MDAKLFVRRKHDSAVEELKAIEAEYMAKKEAAHAMITMTKKWLDELETEIGKSEAKTPVGEAAKSPAESWISARDLTSPLRQN